VHFFLIKKKRKRQFEVSTLKRSSAPYVGVTTSYFYICEQSKKLNVGRASDLYHGLSNHIYYLLRWRGIEFEVYVVVHMHVILRAEFIIG